MQTQDLIQKMKFFGGSDVGTPYVGEKNTDRVLCFMNLSGAYGGNAGVEEARRDAKKLAAAPTLLAALTKAERFIEGFEGDEMQEGVGDLLAEIRDAINAAS